MLAHTEFSGCLCLIFRHEHGHWAIGITGSVLPMGFGGSTTRDPSKQGQLQFLFGRWVHWVTEKPRVFFLSRHLTSPPFHISVSSLLTAHQNWCGSRHYQLSTRWYGVVLTNCYMPLLQVNVIPETVLLFLVFFIHLVKRPVSRCRHGDGKNERPLLCLLMDTFPALCWRDERQIYLLFSALGFHSHPKHPRLKGLTHDARQALGAAFRGSGDFKKPRGGRDHWTRSHSHG